MLGPNLASGTSQSETPASTITAVAGISHNASRLLEQLVQGITGALGHRLGGSDSGHLLGYGLAVGCADAGKSSRVDPVVQAGLRFLPTQLAIDHLPGQRADLGAVEFVGVVVGLLPVGGRGGRNGIDRGAVTIASAAAGPVAEPGSGLGQAVSSTIAIP